ncbi:hypothetical protein NUU61_008264 [Penicillium alfredii]|uniref:Nucleic acid-binding protein n=1 Tax=Penicillium alfredii TaxID=1506179 RepID=A0A9W9JZV6_9EURO|nr:uncharacterized protein NUU61_008264 [Penicillium alfredii]KAJ5086957.1 hypothetical protein NUU61_008264 [Penicillium alfredii]
MAPSHLLRAIMPFSAAMAPSATLARSKIPSSAALIHSVIRSASTKTKIPKNKQPSQPPPNTYTPAALQPPSRLRTYAYSSKTGTVISVGRMDRTVRVSHRHTTFDTTVQKVYPKETEYLVSDPRNSLREGDVIEFSSGAPKTRHVRHVVERIINPFGSAIEDRPPVMSRKEREQERERKWAEKYVRRESRRLGQPIDLAAEARARLPKHDQSKMKNASLASLVHRIHRNNERAGKVKTLVLSRTGGN